MEKIELSPVRTIPGAVTVWHEAGPEIDIVMDLKALTFRPGSVKMIVAHHVLDRLFEDEALAALKNWHACLAKGGSLFNITDDFEYVARAFVGGDIDIGVFNRNHSHATQWDRKSLGDMTIDAGFPEAAVKIWFQEGIPNLVHRKHYELLLEATK